MNDPTADLTDVYAFKSPGQTGRVTLVANVIPIEVPAEGPNYYLLDDKVRYKINVDSNGDGKPEHVFRIQTRTIHKNPNTFLYATGPVIGIRDATLAVQQRYEIFDSNGHGKEKRIASGDVAPNNIGPRAFPHYDTVAAQAIKNGRFGIRAFVGPREDPFFIDVGRIFDLLGVVKDGTDNLAGVGVHAIVLDVPASYLRKSASQPVIGVWGSTERPFKVAKTITKGRGKHKKKKTILVNEYRQIERLGQPLINEVIIPRGKKDYWNGKTPAQDAQFEKYYTKPALAGALNQVIIQPLLDAVLHCGSGCPVAATTGRADISAILLRGFTYPAAGLDLTFGNGASDPKPVDELRLNTSGGPGTLSTVADRRGLLCNFQSPTTLNLHDLDIPPCMPAQLDGYPNGRRLGDDVTDIQIAALLGLPISGLIPSSIQRPYALLAMGLGTDPGSSNPLQALLNGADGVPKNDANGGRFSNTFPYLLRPNPGHN
jgi:hypothetical protein